MTLSFSDLPGSRERQLQRQYNNPLFTQEQRTVTAAQLKKIQDEDLAQLSVFSQDFQQLFDSASQLAENVQSDVILKLKEDADRLYELAACLPGDNSGAQQSLLKLIGVIMQAVKHGAGDDPKALSELQQETEARSMHTELMKVPLVVDMLNPESLIEPDNLAATMLSANVQELEAGLQLFEIEQIQQLYNDSQVLLSDCAEKGHDMSAAQARLEIIENALHQA